MSSVYNHQNTPTTEESPSTVPTSILQHDGTGRRSECRGHRRAAGEHRRIGKGIHVLRKDGTVQWLEDSDAEAMLKSLNVNVKMDESTIERE